MRYSGNYKKLKQDFFMLFIFMDDDESSWDQNSIYEYWNTNIKSATSFIEKWGKHYGYDITIHKGYYSTHSCKFNVRYKGKACADLFKSSAGNDHMKQAISCLGFSSLSALHEKMVKFSKQTQVAYAVIFNKPGIAFCTSNAEQVDGNDFRYAILFEIYPGVSGGTDSAIAHEILHLFGAEDYYDPYKKYPKRLKMAKELCPNDIMLNAYVNIDYNVIDEFTAYSVGWLDKIPEKYNHEDWWK